MKIRYNPSLFSKAVSFVTVPHYMNHTNHNLVIDKEYIAYGFVFSIKNNKIEYLVVDEIGLPFFCDSRLFTITDSQLPLVEWHFNELKTAERQHIFILSYKELVNDPEHFEGLINHNDSVMQRFQVWKSYIDQQYQNPLDEWERVYSNIDDIPISFLQNRYSNILKDFHFCPCPSAVVPTVEKESSDTESE